MLTYYNGIYQSSITAAYTIKRQADALLKLYVTLPLHQGQQKPVRVDLICAMFSVFNYVSDTCSMPLNENPTVFTLTVLTCRAVVACPVGIAAAGSGVCQESAMSRALVHAGGPGALTS